MSHPMAITFAEVAEVVQRYGLLPLSSFIPDHPSLVSITRPEAWHSGAGDESDPWYWRGRFPTEGIAAYGKFLGDKPLLVSRELFPILKCALAPAETVEERYAGGLLAKSTLRIFNCIRENDNIDARALRPLVGMQHSSDKSAFDRSLTELQNTAEIVISGISIPLDSQGNKSGWSSTCYMLAGNWMALHGIAQMHLSREQAKAKLYASIEPLWEPRAVQYLKKRIA